MLFALQDSLTGLGNRRYYDEQLKRAMHHANRQHSKVGLIICDLDKFKQINDTHGHKIGDDILVLFSKALNNSVRDSDSLFRFGGDEFVIIVEDASEKSLLVIEDRINHNLSIDPILTKYQVGCSVGHTFMNRDDNEHSFFERADNMLYQRKHNNQPTLKIIEL